MPAVFLVLPNMAVAASPLVSCDSSGTKMDIYYPSNLTAQNASVTNPFYNKL